ncbi:hypothetical protein EDB84DRAFT_1438030 [Lactarius hengduanensis]|nr:hypothetical protein EDB84DRAFT_1438030 [Lactarius hengduanensis]
MRRMFQNGDAGDHIMRRGKRGKHIGRQYGERRKHHASCRPHALKAGMPRPALVHIVAKLTCPRDRRREGMKGNADLCARSRGTAPQPAQPPRGHPSLLYDMKSNFEPSLAWKCVDMNNSEGPTHHRTQSTLLHGDVALGSEAPRFPRNASGDACGMMRRGKRGKKNGSPVLKRSTHYMRTFASLLALSGDAELIFTWILFCNLGNLGPRVGHARPTPHTHDLPVITNVRPRTGAEMVVGQRQCGKANGCGEDVSAAGVVWEVRSAQLYAAVAPVAPGNLSTRRCTGVFGFPSATRPPRSPRLQRTKMYKVKRPCVLTRRTCRRREHGAHVLREAHTREHGGISKKSDSLISGVSTGKDVHRGRPYTEPRRFPAYTPHGDTKVQMQTVRRLKDKCQEPDMVAFGPHTDAKEAGWSERRCTVVHAVVRRVDTSHKQSQTSVPYTVGHRKRRTWWNQACRTAKTEKLEFYLAKRILAELTFKVLYGVQSVQK